MKKTRTEARLLRHRRLRQKVSGTAARPRMVVHLSGKHVYVQFVDDISQRTLAAVSTLDKEFRANGKKNQSNVAAAKKLGELAARRALTENISMVVFDRGGFRYHGRIAALADAARAAGLKF